MSGDFGGEGGALRDKPALRARNVGADYHNARAHNSNKDFAGAGKGQRESLATDSSHGSQLIVCDD
jgi:hypothetical protein